MSATHYRTKEELKAEFRKKAVEAAMADPTTKTQVEAIITAGKEQADAKAAALRAKVRTTPYWGKTPNLDLGIYLRRTADGTMFFEFKEGNAILATSWSKWIPKFLHHQLV